MKVDYGNGKLGLVEIKDGSYRHLNSYGRVVAIKGATITLEASTIIEGEFSKFAVGEEVLLHVTATNGESGEHLGLYFLTEVAQVLNEHLILKEEPAGFGAVDLDRYYVQAVTIAQFGELTLTDCELMPPEYDVFKYRGGILAFKVFGSFKMIRSKINLTGAGIPYQKKTLRPPVETLVNAEKLTMNCGDGVAFISAYEMELDGSCRIGNPSTHGKAGCSGAANSIFKPANTTDIGGSTILITANEIKGFLPQVVAKYRDSRLPEGRGAAKCLIVTNTCLPYDEKLYNYGIPEETVRVRSLGVKNYGDGRLGKYAASDYQLNNRALVKSVLCNGYIFEIEPETLGGLAALEVGASVLLIASDGEFRLARVLERTATTVTVDVGLESTAEIVTVAQFERVDFKNYTLKSGGILAIAANDTINIQGVIEVGASDLTYAHANSWNKLKSPAIFILARKATFGVGAHLIGNTMLIAEKIEGLTTDTLNGFVYN